MTKPYFQVSVPTTHREQPGRHGLHIFTGPASTSDEAVRCAREACEAALAAGRTATDRAVPSEARWRVRGVCREWAMDWEAATAAFWENEGSLEYPFPVVRTRSEV
ncbi:hypothetical protein ACWEJZ_10970 [Streptomyces bacillaris]|uniref:hypothetical protein n=1 Tax=Streptomyces TaxID=1883 RepID=UPI000A091E62|nr:MULTISPECIES: hypothetical protein [unclassified Streptomyces]ARI53081.1 hypothetical protein A6E92_13385 [Streptomyces sp. S8]NGO86810.1 hypothetical protein [Streptomyces sp. 196(2019)]